MRRQKHSLSHYRLFTCDLGELVPVGCLEVLPGDSIQMASSMLVRSSPLVTPVMHPVSVRIHHWFVPNRLVWSEWENFITGGTDGLGNGAVYPTITGPNPTVQGSLIDYLGIPSGVNAPVYGAMPVRAYQLIYRENYRDQDLITAPVISMAGGNDTTTALTLQKIAWEKDQFTAARPWAQKGPTVTLPLGTTAPVKGIGLQAAVGASAALAGNVFNPGSTVEIPSGQFGWNGAAISLRDAINSAGTPGTSGHGPNIYADLSGATAVDVNTVRRAFALQRFEEARALYGSRYTEYLRFLGVRSSDARLQRPEYLGGGKQTISFSEVLQTGVTTSGTSPAGVGTMAGHGIAGMRSRGFRKFFEEHGHIISLMSVRPRTMYINGQYKMWNRRTREDYWQQELQDIGQEAIQRRELWAEAGAGGDTTFGYNDRYYSYRHHPSFVSGEFRSTLNTWHYARIFGAAPTLNQSFVECDASKRVNQVTSADVLWVMCRHSIQARRLVKRTGIGRIV